uniref:Uncharacterized protein n=1 Tax=Chromera velia CCMP2878 TaxID=1169474 RepID=A0A0G4GIJ8_9ALVE|eukprot:Cvel_4736.t1-p1 / transcript=Cvel_4736.t1 / gene=Cvel_4736 / organism=Chromera_velia_CCMP2878 / gene_product=hypothetical protein / transcript_product=hypothetical protein / location=Cvel_scaffold211:5684-7522(+) / protein_length=89 / sequence_SO=supercontig / SO=protein_coding / is_pseudo=false
MSVFIPSSNFMSEIPLIKVKLEEAVEKCDPIKSSEEGTGEFVGEFALRIGKILCRKRRDLPEAHRMFLKAATAPLQPSAKFTAMKRAGA